MKSYNRATTVRSWIKVLACICAANALLFQGVDATCSMLVSPGDQSAGISAYNDASCKTGGIGCFQGGACRYCKTRETVQSQNFPVCEEIASGTLDVGTPPAPAPTAPAPTTAKPPPATTAPPPVTTAPHPVTTAPSVQIPASTCASAVSTGDQAVGIAGIADANCKNGGLGCFYDGACRYCKTWETPQASSYLPCSNFATTTPTAPAPTTPAPTTPAPTAPAPTPEQSTGGAPSIDTIGTTVVCPVQASQGDQINGINVITDESCSYNPIVGCFQDVCRYCKTKVAAQSQHFIDCPADAIPTSATALTPVTATAPAPAPTTAAPVPTPALAPAGQLIAQACKRSVSLGDSLQGIAVVTDNTCFIQGGVGCVDDYCRFCKTKNTLASQHLLPCSDFPTIPVTVETPASNFCSSTVTNSQALSGIWANVECLEWYKGSCLKSKCPLCNFYDTAVSSGLPACVAPPTAPVVPAALPGAPAPNLRTEAILGEAQPSVGIWATWDQTCSSSDSTCISKCRFCKYADTVMSSPLRWCASIAPLPPAPVFVPSPAGTVRPPTPAPNDCSKRDVTAEKEAAGIWANAQCYEADASGFCISVVCSPCSFYATEQSFKYPACVIGISPYWPSTSTSPLVLVRGATPIELSASDGAGASVGAGAGEQLLTFEIVVAVAAAVGIVAVFAMVIYGAKRLLEGATTEDASSILCDSSIENGEGHLQQVQQMLPQRGTSCPRRKVKAPRTPVIT